MADGVDSTTKDAGSVRLDGNGCGGSMALKGGWAAAMAQKGQSSSRTVGGGRDGSNEVCMSAAAWCWCWWWCCGLAARVSFIGLVLTVELEGET